MTDTDRDTLADTLAKHRLTGAGFVYTVTRQIPHGTVQEPGEPAERCSCDGTIRPRSQARAHVAEEFLSSDWLAAHDVAVTARAHAPIWAALTRGGQTADIRCRDAMRLIGDPAAATQHDTGIARQTLTDAADDLDRHESVWGIRQAADILRDRAAALGQPASDPADYGPADDRDTDPSETICRTCGHAATEHSPGRYSIYGKCPVTSVEPGCTCGGMAACPQCQDRDRAVALGQPHGQTGNSHE